MGAFPRYFLYIYMYQFFFLTLYTHSRKTILLIHILSLFIYQAQFKYCKIVIMILLFCLIFPIGIGIGIGISNIYQESSPKALIVEGLLLSASAGVLINMALVDLLATDFMSTKMLRSFRLQLGASLSLLIGLTCMSILALWE